LADEFNLDASTLLIRKLGNDGIYTIFDNDDLFKDVVQYYDEKN